MFLIRGQDRIVSAIEDRIARYTMIPVENGEGFQVRTQITACADRSVLYSFALTGILTVCHHCVHPWPLENIQEAKVLLFLT